jgi:MFS family permease
VGVLAGGVLADRWGRRPTLIVAHLGTAGTLLGLGLASSAWAIVAWSTASPRPDGLLTVLRDGV